MRTPRTKKSEDGERQTSFVSAHETARKDGYTGTVELSNEEVRGGAVFLNGVVVYARYRHEVAEEALESLLSVEGNRPRKLPSTTEAVRMFRTYLRYLSDEGLLTAEPLDGATVESHSLECVMLDGVENSTDTNTFSTRSSMSVKAEEKPSSFLPEGRMKALVSDRRSLRRHVADREATGYAVGDYEIAAFRDGEFVDERNGDFCPSLRAEVGLGGGWVVVETNEKEDENRDKESLLGRIF